MKKMFAVLAVAGVISGSNYASDNTIIKLGYETVNQDVLGQSLDLKGLSIGVEIPMNPSGGGLLSTFASYSKLDLKQNSLLGIPIDGDANAFSVGFKYNFCGSLDSEMSKEEAASILSKKASFYLKLGYESVDANGTVGIGPGAISLSDKDRGLVYGVGFETKSSGNVGLFVEWLDHKADNLDDSSIKFGVFARF